MCTECSGRVSLLKAQPNIPTFPNWNLTVSFLEDFQTTLRNIPEGWHLTNFLGGFAIAEPEITIVVMYSPGQDGTTPVMICRVAVDGGLELLAKYSLPNHVGGADCPLGDLSVEEIIVSQLNSYMNGCHNISRMIWDKEIDFQSAREGFKKMARVFRDVSKGTDECDIQGTEG